MIQMPRLAAALTVILLAFAHAGLAQTSEMVKAIRQTGTPPYGDITDIHPQLERAKPGGVVEG